MRFFAEFNSSAIAVADNPSLISFKAYSIRICSPTVTFSLSIIYIFPWLPAVCPFANGYYDRIKNALAALLDGSGQFSRAALADTARQFTVCPFELGLDLSEWCDVVIGDYNYLFDPVVHLKRFFDTSGDWLFLIDEAHNLPDRARAMYSARFCKSSLTDAKRTLGKGKSALKTALTKADKLSKQQQQRQKSALAKQLQLPKGTPLVVTSSAKGTGIDEVRRLIEEAAAR